MKRRFTEEEKKEIVSRLTEAQYITREAKELAKKFTFSTAGSIIQLYYRELKLANQSKQDNPVKQRKTKVFGLRSEDEKIRSVAKLLNLNLESAMNLYIEILSDESSEMSTVDKYRNQLILAKKYKLSVDKIMSTYKMLTNETKKLVLRRKGF